MVVPPCSSHSPRVDVVWYDIAVVSELGTADAAFTALGSDLFIEQLSHLSIRAEFAISSRMKWIFDSPDELARLEYGWLSVPSADRCTGW